LTVRLRSNALTLLALSLVAMTTLALHRTQQLAPVEGMALRALVPVQGMFNGAGQRLQRAIDTAKHLNSLRAENQELRRQVNELLLGNVHLIEVEQQNLQLRELLDFKQKNPDYTVRVGEVIGRLSPATVVGRDPNNLTQALIIDQGAADGVHKGMPVVTAGGLVGRVVEADLNWAKVLLLTDSSSHVSALLQTSRATGVVIGRQGRLYLRYVPQGDELTEGDIVVTSGLGGHFPKGLVIGQVSLVRKRDVDMFQEAEIRSVVDFSRLELVIVLQDFTPIESLP